MAETIKAVIIDRDRYNRELTAKILADLCGLDQAREILVSPDPWHALRLLGECSPQVVFVDHVAVKAFKAEFGTLNNQAKWEKFLEEYQKLTKSPILLWKQNDEDVKLPPGLAIIEINRPPHFDELARTLAEAAPGLLRE